MWLMLLQQFCKPAAAASTKWLQHKHRLMLRLPQSIKIMHDMQMFTPRQKGQLDVYGIWGVLRGKLMSDDSFDFNKAASRIKESISHLPDAAEQDDALLAGVQVSSSFCFARPCALACCLLLPFFLLFHVLAQTGILAVASAIPWRSWF